MSYFRAPITTLVPCGEMSLRDVYDYVVGGAAREEILALRNIADARERRKYKCTKLDYVTPSALVAKRNSEGIIRHTGVLCIDIDHIESEEQLQEVKAALIADGEMPPTLVFRSPSGDGLKVFYQLCDKEREVLECNDTEDVIRWHKRYYDALRHYLEEKHGVKTDATSDVARSCYLCHDADAYYNEECDVELISFIDSIADARVMRPYIGDGNMVENSQIADTRAVCPYIERTDWDTVEALVRGIEQAGVDITGDYHQWMRIGFALASAFGESGRGFYHRVSRFYDGYSNRDCNRQYDRCLRAGRGGVGLGTFIYIAKTA